jgi:hypothetical protein
MPRKFSSPEEKRDYDAKKQRIHRARSRTETLHHYGAICLCCGESLIAFLMMAPCDPAAWPAGVPKQQDQLIDWLIAHKYPHGFQVLCANCNHAKGHEGLCPHERARFAEAGCRFDSAMLRAIEKNDPATARVFRDSRRV